MDAGLKVVLPVLANDRWEKKKDERGVDKWKDKGGGGWEWLKAFYSHITKPGKHGFANSLHWESFT